MERLAAWIRSYGPSQLAKDLRVDRSTVHDWVAANPEYRYVPRLEYVKRMILMSRDHPMLIGPLDYKDFFGEV